MTFMPLSLAATPAYPAARPFSKIHQPCPFQPQSSYYRSGVLSIAEQRSLQASSGLRGGEVRTGIRGSGYTKVSATSASQAVPSTTSTRTTPDVGVHVQRSSKPIVKPSDEAERQYRPVLTLDGGILKGAVTACVLEKVEDSIKAALIARGQAKSRKEVFKRPDEFDIQLADWFVLIAGTSTGSLLATYLASKGGDPNFLSIDPDVREVALNNPHYQGLLPGSARAAQALYLAKAAIIFPVKNLQRAVDQTLIPFGMRLIDGINFPFPTFGSLKPALRLFLKTYVTPQLIQAVKQGTNIDLVNLLESKYPQTGLQDTLQAVFGKTLCVADLATSLLVPYFELDYRRASAFWYSHATATNGLASLNRTLGQAINNAPPGALTQDGALTRLTGGQNYFLWELPNASSRAPTYFPSASIRVPAYWMNKPGTGNAKAQVVDGGLTANDPSVLALVFMMLAPLPTTQVAILSIGCGNLIDSMDVVRQDAGQLDWITGPLISILTSGNEEIAPLLVERLLQSFPQNPQGRYLRIQKVLLRNAANLYDGDSILHTQLDGAPVQASAALKNSDDPRYVRALLEVGQQVANDNAGNIQNFVNNFVVPP